MIEDDWVVTSVITIYIASVMGACVRLYSGYDVRGVHLLYATVAPLWAYIWRPIQIAREKYRNAANGKKCYSFGGSFFIELFDGVFSTRRRAEEFSLMVMKKYDAFLMRKDS